MASKQEKPNGMIRQRDTIALKKIVGRQLPPRICQAQLDLRRKMLVPWSQLLRSDVHKPPQKHHPLNVSSSTNTWQ